MKVYIYRYWSDHLNVNINSLFSQCISSVVVSAGMLRHSYVFIMSDKKIYTCVSNTTAINLGPESSRFYKAR